MRSGIAPRGPALWRALGLAAAIALAVLFPLAVSNQEAVTIGVFTMIFVGGATAWNMFAGYSGYISLGHAVFFGSGAYAAGLAAEHWSVTGGTIFWLLPLAAAVAAAMAVPFGLIALRVRRHTFVVVTIAFMFIFQLMAFNFSFTNGSSGLNAPFLTWAPVAFNDRFYYLAFAMAVMAAGLSWLIRRSRFGLQLRSIREDEDRARGLGVRATAVKLGAFAISAAITGLLGAVWFYFVGQVQPQTGYDPLFDLSVALMAFLGGLGTVAGPVIGGLILEPTQQYLTETFTNTYLSQVLLGAVFLAVILFMPRGLVPTIGSRLRSWQARRTSRETATVITQAPVPASTQPALDPARAREGRSG